MTWELGQLYSVFFLSSQGRCRSEMKKKIYMSTETPQMSQTKLWFYRKWMCTCLSDHVCMHECVYMCLTWCNYSGQEDLVLFRTLADGGEGDDGRVGTYLSATSSSGSTVHCHRLKPSLVATCQTVRLCSFPVLFSTSTKDTFPRKTPRMSQDIRSCRGQK